MYKIYLILPLFYSHLFSTVFIDDLKDAKVGECYKKITIPAKYETKDELIEVEKASQKVIVQNPSFIAKKESIITSPEYIDIKGSMAKFKTQKIKLPISEQKTYFTIGKSHDIPLEKKYIEYLKKNSVDLEHLKVGQCLIEYATFPKKSVVKKSYEKKQAYEIIDVTPAKFKTIKKKIEVKPAFTKIVKTPAVYETKSEKILVSPSQKVYEKDGDLVCIKEKPAVYKTITKRVLISPPKTKVIKFPPTFKEIEVKVLQSPPKVSRRVIPPKKEYYDFYVDSGEGKYIWLKDDKKTTAKPTGLKICKKVRDVKFITKEVQKVLTPATTKEVKVKEKVEQVIVQKLSKDANSTIKNIPPQYEKVKVKVVVEPSKTVWEKVECKKSADTKTKAVK